MDIRTAAIFTGKFRVDPAAVTEGTCLSFIFLHKTVPLDETYTDPADLRGLHMTITAGSVTNPAGLFKNIFVKDLGFCG
jgi:hypothetical protein